MACLTHIWKALDSIPSTGEGDKLHIHTHKHTYTHKCMYNIYLQVFLKGLEECIPTTNCGYVLEEHYMGPMQCNFYSLHMSKCSNFLH